MISDLTPLLLDLTGLDDTAIEALGIKTYNDLYLQTAQRGIHKAHDGESVYFYKNVGTGHALHKTISQNKDTICPLRVERVKWIKEFICGNVADSECWLVPDKRGFDKRLYASFRHGYVIWLSPRDDGGWNFKSAYPASTETIRRYVKTPGATCLRRFTSALSPTEQPQPSLQSADASSQTEPLPVLDPPCLLPDGSTPEHEDSSLAVRSSQSRP
jgi:hypothetical protein